MDFVDIKVEEREDGIGIILLDRPEKKNAINIRMRREISACLNNWKDSTNIGVGIITGKDSAFSSGFDLSEFSNENLYDELFESSSRYHKDVWNFPKPIIAAINGPAMGGGFDLAVLCDFRICSESAFFGHPEIKFGGPPLYTPLRWIIGDGLARDLCLTGRKIHAQEAYRIGLVNEIVEGDSCLDRAIEIGKIILEAPYETIEFTKKYLINNSGKGFEESFYIEHDKAFKDILLKKVKNKFK